MEKSKIIKEENEIKRNPKENPSPNDGMKAKEREEPLDNYHRGKETLLESKKRSLKGRSNRKNKKAGRRPTYEEAKSLREQEEHFFLSLFSLLEQGSL